MGALLVGFVTATLMNLSELELWAHEGVYIAVLSLWISQFGGGGGCSKEHIPLPTMVGWGSYCDRRIGDPALASRREFALR